MMLHYACGDADFSETAATRSLINRRAVYGYDQRVEVFGSEGDGVCGYNVGESTVKFFSSQALHNENPLPDFTVRYREAYRTEILHFDSVTHHTPVVCTGEERIGPAYRYCRAAIIKSGLPVKSASDIYL